MCLFIIVLPSSCVYRRQSIIISRYFGYKLTRLFIKLSFSTSTLLAIWRAQNNDNIAELIVLNTPDEVNYWALACKYTYLSIWATDLPWDKVFTEKIRFLRNSTRVNPLFVPERPHISFLDKRDEVRQSSRVGVRVFTPC